MLSPNSEHRWMEEALRESEARFRALFDQANDAIFMIHDGVFVDCNLKGLAMCGRTRDEIIGHAPDEFSPLHQPDGISSHDKLAEVTRKALAGEPQFFEWTSCRPDGTPFRTEVSLNRLELVGKVYLQATSRDITERKRAEENNVRSLALLRATLDSTADGILTIGPDRQILSYNEMFVKMWRIPPEVLSTNDDSQAIQCVLSQLKSPELFLAKVSHLYEHPLEESFDVLDFSDGRVFERFSRPMLAEGQPIGRVWSFRDITERKRAEKVLYESETRFRTLIEQSPVAINVSRDGFGIYANQKFLQLFGLKSLEESVGRHVSTYFAPEFQAESRERVRRRSLRLPVPNEFETFGQKVNGFVFPMRVDVSQVELADGSAEIGFVTDITERKRAAEQIAEQAALLDKAQDAILVRDLPGEIRFWSKGAERMYGWTRQEALGRNILQLNQTDPAKFDEINHQLVSQGEWYGEVQQVNKDGQYLAVEVRCTLIRDNEGHPKAVLAINTDITEKKKIEAQFMRAQRMESIGTLAGGIAHDLNNILAPIMMSIEVLKKTATDPQAKSILETIGANAKRGADIVRQVLSFARGLEGDRVEIQPDDLLKDIETIIKDTFPKNIRLELSLADNPWKILGDPTQLHQILLNLCLNARDAMPRGGCLSVSMENSVLHEPCVAVHLQGKAGRYVQINVKDSGVGIPPAILDKIFEPFFTTKEFGKGTGIGLSTVLAIVKSHGGFINVYSEPGEGTTFKVYFPAMDKAPAVRQSVSSLPALPRGNNEMVLVVDDEFSVLSVTSQTLEAFGYRTLTAKDGVEAVAIYTERHHEIDAVLTDMAMPVMDGPATILALKQVNPAIKIVVASGSASSTSVTGDPDWGVRHFLTKPYTAGTLLKTMREMLDEGTEKPTPAEQA